jgi:HD superfamily phosphohydrolase
MNNEIMNASAFLDNSNIIYNEQFEKILIQIIICYDLMRKAKVILPNDENKIRNKLVNNYLMDNTIRTEINLTDYRFERETPEDNDEGRVDIKIVSRKDSFFDTKAFYIIECKRLDSKNRNGKTGLNAKYVLNGIARFISGKYSMYKNTAGMIGFVVSQMDIHENIGCINQLLQNTFTEINTATELTEKQMNPSFKYSYYSCHKVGISTNMIYHLMFDFSNNIALPQV